LKDLEKIPCSRPRKEKKIMHGKLRGKNIMHGLCGKKKFLQIIDIFQWVGWLVQIPACCVANLSAVFTSKLCLSFKQLAQKQEFILSSVNKISFKSTY